MRVRDIPSRKTIERVEDICNKEIFEALRIEIAVNIITTARFFGMGKTRAKKYIEFMNETRKEFLKYQDDEILEIKIDEEFRRLGFPVSELFEDIPSRKELLRRSRAKKKNTVSIAQAHEMSQKVDAMKKFIEEQQKGA